MSVLALLSKGDLTHGQRVKIWVLAFLNTIRSHSYCKVFISISRVCKCAWLTVVTGRYISVRNHSYYLSNKTSHKFSLSVVSSNESCFLGLLEEVVFQEHQLGIEYN